MIEAQPTIVSRGIVAYCVDRRFALPACGDYHITAICADHVVFLVKRETMIYRNPFFAVGTCSRLHLPFPISIVNPIILQNLISAIALFKPPICGNGN